VLKTRTVPRRRQLHDRAARHDAAYGQAKASGFAARAVFKLEELDQRFKLIGPGRRVLDLGCWPGSWLQYAAERVGEDGLVVGVDRKQVEIALPSWAHARVADVEALRAEDLVAEFGVFDTVLSDLAPQTTGDRTTDQYRSEVLTGRALDLARGSLRPGGHFAAKVFVGGGFKALLDEVKASFSEARAYHPKATRAGSIEQYVVGRGLKAGAAVFANGSSVGRGS
jgi:23S rRNA (uridine2552-2'-O)-methyltransferase